MKTLTIFYLEACPYCVHARRALGELQAENPAYAGVPVKWIDERREAALAAKYDYYYVPSVYLDGRKLFEADPAMGYAEIKRGLFQALEAALAA